MTAPRAAERAPTDRADAFCQVLSEFVARTAFRMTVSPYVMDDAETETYDRLVAALRDALREGSDA